MPIDRFFIAPYDKDSGLQNNVKPWLISDEAFSELTNAYIFRGRVRKRFGSKWIGENSLVSRLRVSIGTTNGSGNFNGFVPRSEFVANTPLVTPAIGQQFSVGTQVFTVDALGTPASLLISGTAIGATFDTSSGNVNSGNVIIVGAAINTTVYYYPALPVMGLLVFETNLTDNEITIAFDTRFAYEYNGGWDRLVGESNAGANTWTGSDSDFFWGTTWSGADPSNKVFYVTNFNQLEPQFMRTFFNNQWDSFEPQIDAVPDFLFCARILVPFKNRLVAFNTWEGTAGAFPGNNYQNRARYSQIGSPLDVDAWRQDIPGRGNAIDCPTSEAIITVEFVKDRLIVFFERSTWEFVYTGNQAYPFAWQQINTELGAESTFSIVPFDKVCIGIGNVGIHACNGANVERIDDKIPDEVFEIHNADSGIERVYGIRDYSVEMVYWSFPGPDASATYPYPNRVLVYNYKTATWAFNQDSITAFGYFWPQTGVTWSSVQVTWDDDLDWTGGAVQSLRQQAIGGNQQGYTFIIDPDHTRNASVLQITNLTVAANQVTITSINHNLREDEYVLLSGIIDMTGNLGTLNNKIFRVDQVIDQNNFEVSMNPPPVLAGTYDGAGLIARVSNLFIRTKEYNFYAQQGRNAYVSRVDFMVDKTSQGQVLVNFFASTSAQPLSFEGFTNHTLMGTSVLETSPYVTVPFEQDATRLWHSVYIPAEGEVVSLFLSMLQAQMVAVTDNEDGTISGPALEDFQLHSMIFFATPTSTRLQ